MKRLISLLILVLLPGWVLAGNIRIEMHPSAHLVGTQVTVRVALSNQGSEKACQVRTEVELAGQRVTSAPLDEIVPGESNATTVVLSRPITNGYHHALITVQYTDRLGAPFSAVTTCRVVSAEPGTVRSSIRLDMPSVELVQTSTVTVTATNTGPVDRAVRIRLHTPTEITGVPPQDEVVIPARGSVSLRFTLSNQTATVSSRYVVCAIGDYLADGFLQSTVTECMVEVLPPAESWVVPAGLHLAIIVSLLFLAIASVWLPEALRLRIPARMPALCDGLILIGLAAFTAHFIPGHLLMTDTMAIGGDTVAHNYLASHLKETLLHEGRIVSWANGWWGGFPAFQFYFCLPYVLMVLLNLVIPFNIAFKLVSVFGIFALPAAAYTSARIMRATRPIPILAAIAMIPFLFDNGHTMWGVNILSTFAGMISNSLSFPVMLIFLAMAERDSNEGRFRLRTVILLALLIASHFFTSLLAGLITLSLPFLSPACGTRKAFITLTKEAALAFLLMAWWLVPLVAKQEYSMDFGTNWNVSLKESFPLFLLPCIPAAYLALIRLLSKPDRWTSIHLLLLLSALGLFFFGAGHVSPIFVNVRLWPFIIYALLVLAATGLGHILNWLHTRTLAVVACAMAACVFGTPGAATVAAWARWNYSGMERKAMAGVYEALVGSVLPGTSGRLANDLSDDNNALGSSRIFESVPHRIGKPILEGGLVNSAAGSMFAYYIQGETSQGCAGFPEIVTPTNFNFARAEPHLRLFNVQHFIARAPQTKAALAASTNWGRLNASHGWELYGTRTNTEGYVYVPQNAPIAVRVQRAGSSGLDWKHAGLRWIYCIDALHQPFALLRDTERDAVFPDVLSAPAYIDRLDELSGRPSSGWSHDPDPGWVTDEEVTDNRIRFRTRAIGRPHIIKITYYPNWKVRGAARIYMVTPCFMLVYPEQEDVELYYGSTAADHAGHALTILGALLMLGLVLHRVRGAGKSS